MSTTHLRNLSMFVYHTLELIQVLFVCVCADGNARKGIKFDTNMYRDQWLLLSEISYRSIDRIAI